MLLSACFKVQQMKKERPRTSSAPRCAQSFMLRTRACVSCAAALRWIFRIPDSTMSPETLWVPCCTLTDPGEHTHTHRLESGSNNRRVESEDSGCCPDWQTEKRARAAESLCRWLSGEEEMIINEVVHVSFHIISQPAAGCTLDWFHI